MKGTLMKKNGLIKDTGLNHPVSHRIASALK